MDIFKAIKEKFRKKDDFLKISDLPLMSSPLDDDLVFPMDFKYAAPPSREAIEKIRMDLSMLGPPRKDMTATERMMYDKLQADFKRMEDDFLRSSPNPWSVTGGINIHIPTAKDTKRYAISASYATTSSYAVPPGFSFTASWAPNPNVGKIPTVGSGGFNWASTSTTASYATGFDPSWVGAISGKYVIGQPCMDGYLKVTVNIGDPGVLKATVSFKDGSLSRMVWLNDNVSVVQRALAKFSEQFRQYSGAGNKPWFNCVIQGEGVTYEPKRITFDGLIYDEHVIKAGLSHRVDIEGQDPMKVLTEIATKYKFFIVGDMEIDEDENIIEDFIIQEFWAVNPQTHMNDLIFRA